MSLNERLIGAGAVACTADTTDVFGDGSGIALYTMDYDASDESGSYDGIPTNVEFGVEGQINYGAGFNGSSSEITVNSFASLSQLGLSMWVNMPDITSSYALAARYGTNREFAIYNYQASNGFIASIYYNGNNGNAIIITAGDYLTNNTWHHIAFTSDGSTAPKLYIDGVERGTAQFSDAARCAYYTSTEPLAIGHFTTNSAYNLEGKIDQVRIFNKALNQTEVDTLYAETACVYTCTTDTVDYPTTNVAYYKLDNSAEDETGTYDGTATNVNYTFGRFGQAAVFNGSSSKITTPYNALFNDFSISFWVKMNDLSYYQVLLGTTDSFASQEGLGIFYDSSLNTIGFDGNINGARITVQTGSYQIIQNQWHHVVFTNNSSNNEKILYIDDNLQVNNTSLGYIDGQNYGLVFGSYNAYSNNRLNGSIDQVRIFSSALTSTQVTELYEEYECEDTSTFKPVLYTGNGSTQYISNVGFEPDFVWVKNRSSSNQNHALFDSVRGVQRELRSDSTAVEQNRNGTIYSLKSFDDNGFTVGDNTAGNYNVNGAVGGLYSGNAEFVAWCWKAGGLAVTNTDGTITSQVSANTAAGFSVVTYVGSVSQTGTVGHGLDIAPNVIIVKNRDNLYNWVCYFSELGASDFLVLNQTYASSSPDSRPWNDTAPTSSVFTASNGNFIPVNQNGSDFVAYCFHSVAGYSSIGSYNGTGSAGNFVSTSVDGDAGFEPAFVMIKRSNGTGDWFIYDNKRASNLYLRPNLSNAEGTDGGIVFNSNGFTINVAYSDHNAIGGEYIYMAFA